MRIMYVEDNMVNLALVERVARMGGHTIISYTNGADALEALKTDEANLILMDIELEGELDGTQVIAKLRERGDHRPIIAVTAYAMVGDMERIMSAGSNGYLPKPIPIAELLEVFAKYDPENEPPDSADASEESSTSAEAVIAPVKKGTGSLDPAKVAGTSPAAPQFDQPAETSQTKHESSAATEDAPPSTLSEAPQEPPDAPSVVEKQVFPMTTNRIDEALDKAATSDAGQSAKQSKSTSPTVPLSSSPASETERKRS